MSFGKRGAGNGGADKPTVTYVPEVEADADPVIGGARLKMSSSGGASNLRFAVLAVGVVAISAGAALGVSSLISAAKPARTIEAIVAADPDRDHIKVALANEAFPDAQGASFMIKLAHEFPVEHDRLLGKLADSAKAGADRDALTMEVNEWLVDFVPANSPALGRTGADGFDMAINVVSDGLRYVEQTAGGCTMPALERLMTNPDKLLAAVAYGSKGYEYNMKTSRQVVQLAAAGRDAPDIDTTLTPQDERALQAVMLSVMMDKDVMALMSNMMSGASSGSGTAAMQHLQTNLDICGLGRRVVQNLNGLPRDTKARLWATGAKELSKVMASGRLPSSFPTSMMAPGQLSMR